MPAATSETRRTPPDATRETASAPAMPVSAAVVVVEQDNVERAVVVIAEQIVKGWGREDASNTDRRKMSTPNTARTAV